MTDRVHYLTVALDRDIRTDDVESLVEAVKHLRHVQGVELGIVTSETHMARMQARSELREQLYTSLEAIFNPPR